ncbi:alpha/beta hydrolase [uncultured Tateyamaria sp.]|uniref:alpha/beta fold hydrolase n=1 Tax=uncultured Tateyamaria sp. TaxID=455651 RepID=UPI0026226912|nr:alpha/beta hydrolase [uncultured Tateyamaria sp.]
MWVVIILLGILAIPLTIEWMRNPVSERQRREAPGKFALLSQGTTHYAWLGPERGPVALCIHGLSTSSYVWRGMAKGLALMGFRVLVYDHYGRGLSDTVRGKQDAAFFLQQMTDLLAHEQVDEPLTVLGYSMGGAIATHFAAAYPGKVRQLILLAPAGMQEISGRRVRAALDWPLIGDWLFLLLYPFTLRKGIAAEAGLSGSVEGINEMQHAETDRRGYFPAILSSLRGVLRGTAKAEHKAIAEAGLPVLAIWGAADDVVAPTGKDKLAKWNPRARQVIIPGAGHGLTYTHTDQVLEAMQATRG